MKKLTSAIKTILLVLAMPFSIIAPFFMFFVGIGMIILFGIGYLIAMIFMGTGLISMVVCGLSIVGIPILNLLYIIKGEPPYFSWLDYGTAVAGLVVGGIIFTIAQFLYELVKSLMKSE